MYTFVSNVNFGPNYIMGHMVDATSLQDCSLDVVLDSYIDAIGKYRCRIMLEPF